ncbi:MAG: hypothetical protein DRP91_07340 [Candidatus Neomarinimicrobiota bacterium]|nr:MAG: hypothetical protein DRP91_07340 [Candidatus Neomarinimicrobiota bacterium]
MRRIALVVLSLLLVMCEEKIIYKHETDPPVFQRVPEVVEVRDTSVVISWKTDEPTKADLYYWFTEDSVLVQSEAEFRENHEILVRGLEPYTKYYYQVEIIDFEDNGPVKSRIDSFRTCHNEFSCARVGWVFLKENRVDSVMYYVDMGFAFDSLSPDILALLGWLRLKEDSLAMAKNLFYKSLRQDNLFEPALVGLSYLFLVSNDPDSSIILGEMTFADDAEWKYKYCPGINYRVARVILAEAYYQKGDLGSAQRQVDFIWSESGLIPDDPTTWKLGQEEFSSYEEALLAVILYLKDEVLMFINSKG